MSREKKVTLISAFLGSVFFTFIEIPLSELIMFGHCENYGWVWLPLFALNGIMAFLIPFSLADRIQSALLPGTLGRSWTRVVRILIYAVIYEAVFGLVSRLVINLCRTGSPLFMEALRESTLFWPVCVLLNVAISLVVLEPCDKAAEKIVETFDKE